MLERTAAQSAALAEELRNVVRQAEKLIEAIGEDRAEVLGEVRERLGVALTDAKARLSDFEDQARRFGDNAGAAVDSFVQENPWTAVGIGTAIGLILGSWIASGSRE
jgi:ElaB/YqjD/DUF883 family membrane-anchored ribosome-binding protein